MKRMCIILMLIASFFCLQQTSSALLFKKIKALKALSGHGGGYGSPYYGRSYGAYYGGYTTPYRESYGGYYGGSPYRGYGGYYGGGRGYGGGYGSPYRGSYGGGSYYGGYGQRYPRQQPGRRGRTYSDIARFVNPNPYAFVGKSNPYPGQPFYPQG